MARGATGAAAALQRRAGQIFWKRVAPVRNRRFESALEHDPRGPVLILSPHLDDAVVDCWSVLVSDRAVRVVNVCGKPPAHGTTSHWDRIVGVPDSARLFELRLAEDRDALALAGREPLNLPFVESQHRVGRRPPSFAELDAELVKAVPAASLVLAPMALGTIHPDHALIRSYALAIGVPVELYADMPYATVYGWPAWVTGAAADPHLDVDAYWADTLEGLPVGERPRIVELGEDQAADKLRAMKAYATQFPSLDRGPIGLLSNPQVHRYELFWETRP